MQTGIEKFKNVIDPETCDSIIKNIESNIDKSQDFVYGPQSNVICKQLNVVSADLDDLIRKPLQKISLKYSEKYTYFSAYSDTGFQLRKISGATRKHVDTVRGADTRNVSIIVGLNSDYEKGEFHFPYQDFVTTVKRGEAIIFPVWYMYPHYVDAPIGYRYTINTWLKY